MASIESKQRAKQNAIDFPASQGWDSQPVPGSVRIVKETQSGCLLGFRVQVARWNRCNQETRWFKAGRRSPSLEMARIMRDWFQQREQARMQSVEFEEVE